MHGFQNPLEPGNKFLKIAGKLVKQAGDAVHQLGKNDPDQPGEDEDEEALPIRYCPRCGRPVQQEPGGPRCPACGPLL